nr:helix-turn-helix domain-containing protein [uncultured Olsenella sp.]
MTKTMTVGGSFERTYSITELSEMTGIPRSTLNDATTAGRLHAFKLPGCTRGKRVTESEVRRFLGEDVVPLGA